jgi:methylmalonyl-CoA mutase
MPRTDGQTLSGRGPRRWIVTQMVDDPDPERANVQALEDFRGGATGLALRFAAAASPGAAGLPATDEALRVALDGVDLRAIQLRVEPHPRTLVAARWVTELVGRQGIAPELTDIAWGLEPMALSSEASGVDSVGMVDTFRGLMNAGFTGPLADMDGRAIHEAGGSEAQELAAALAGAAWWLRALDGAGVDAVTALPYFGVSLAVDQDQFLSIAKLRAMRILWARLLEICGAPPSPQRIHAETSRRMMTRSDPHTNLLRTTIAAFAAGVGGADSITVLPFDTALRPSERSARALARNIQHLLLDESQLHRVADPSAGSGLAESLTEKLAETAWAEFQAVEGEGGILESLRTGAFPARIAHSRKELQAKLVSGAAPLVGATIYRDAGQPLGTGAQEPALDGPAGLAPVNLETLAQAAA